MLIAVVAVIIAMAWGAVAVAGFWSEVQGFDRTDVPGELTIDIEDIGTYVVYYERREWFASVPVGVDLDVTVTGPEGDQVTVTDRDGITNYRLLELVGQSHAAFDADQTGTYTVAVDEAPPHDDASIAVGDNITGTLLRPLIGPAVLLLIGLVVAGGVAATTTMNRGREARQET